MEKEDSMDKLEKQIKELQEESEHFNDMLDESIDEEEKYDSEDTKEFIEKEIEEEDIDEEVENTKEFNKQDDSEEEYVPKHEKETEEEPKKEIEEKKEEEKKEEEKVEPKKNNKKKIIITLIILIVLAIFILLAILIPPLLKGKEEIEVEKEDKYSQTNLKKILNNYGKSIEDVISINLETKKELLKFEEADDLVEFPNRVKCKTKEVYEDGKIYLDECTVDGHKTKAKYGEKQEAKEEVAEVVEDGSFYVYEKDNKYTLEAPKEEEKDKYNKYLVTTGTEPTGITLLNEYNAKYVFYYDKEMNVWMKNIKTNKDAVPQAGIQSVLPIYFKGNYDQTYVAVTNGVNWGIYNLNTGLLDIKLIYNDLSPYLYMGISGPPQRVEALTENNIAAIDSKNNIGVINYKTGGEVVPFDTNAMQKSGSYLWKYNYAFNENTHETEYTNKSIYDYDGNKYLDKKYDDIYGIVNGKYILVKDNKDIKMVLIDGKELYNYKEIDNLGQIHYFIDYNESPLFQFNKKDKSGTNYDNECIEVSYDTKAKKGSYKDYYCGGIAKPILYLYPTEQTNVKITFDHPDLLKTTYPKYNKEWNVTVKEDGTITDSNGRNYYALYWDEKQKNRVDFKYGYYVTGNNAIKFLEEKLFEIGLTEREANEFIMYWLPKLEDNKKSLVYFELTEEKEKYNKINIEPKPDSLLRLTIHIKKVNKETKIKEQKIKPFVRNGFTAVEWGGVEY